MLLPLAAGQYADTWFNVSAAESVTLALTQERLSNGVGVDTVWLDTPFGQDGITWLQSAATRGLESVVELLLEYENGNLTRRLQYALDIQYWRRSGRG